MNTIDIPEFETERLILRAITLDDRAAIFDNHSDPEVAGWFFDQHFTHIEQADQIIQEFIATTSPGKIGFKFDLEANTIFSAG